MTFGVKFPTTLLSSQFNMCLRMTKVPDRSRSTDVLYKLLRKGLVKQIYPPDIKTASGSPCAYAGFDATSDSLHVGNLLVLVALLNWQRAGFETIVVIGDATTEIGDPSGHSSDRNMLSRSVIEKNADSIEKNIQFIFDNHEKYVFPKAKTKQKLGKFRILRNSEWYKNTPLLDFYSEAGRNIRIGEMLSRTSVRSRMESGAGMNFSEFSYQLFQSYDWLYLFKNYNCRFQFGGSDQLGNITSGHSLISGVLYQSVIGALLPLIQSETGDKFGKSSGNAVYLSSHKTSPFDFYQFFMRLPDKDACQYFPLFSFLSQAETEDVVQRHMKNPDSRSCQRRLADEVTSLVYGEKGLQLAEHATKILYQSDLSSLAALTIEELSQVLPSSSSSELVYEPGTTLLNLVMKIGCFLNESDAKRIISEGGVYVNFERVSFPQHVIIPELHVLPNQVTLIRIGKKTYYLVKWK